ARAARDEFQRVFRDREAPEEVPQKNLARSGLTRVSTLVFISDLAASRAEAERLIKQGAIEIDGQRVDNVRAELDLSKPNSFLLRAGKKKFLRVIVE
ncbi:MAG: S4 domain-containing protein, partial [Candidatus Acidiferrales bacterium]